MSYTDVSACRRGHWYDGDACDRCAMTEIPVADLARVAFDAYSASTGGKTYDGRPIPPFATIREKTPHVADAWEAAATAILARLGVTR